ncbi:MAG: prepilin-type N-terminal cleavage/methylation domain-containing protein [Candidatus Omnitrophica bacterium]|nr:prepilin-type N-terminal cleavage/methylation domain-containing protein [Candidatus Omnitrophota bacterium]
MKYNFKKICFTAGFSMVELMITVAIVSSCLVVITRGFSVSMMRMSLIRNEVYAASLLDEKISELRITAAKDKGLKKGGVPVSDEEGYGLSIGGDITQYMVYREVIRNGRPEIIETGTDRALLRMEALWPRGGREIQVILPGKAMKESSVFSEGRKT